MYWRIRNTPKAEQAPGMIKARVVFSMSSCFISSTNGIMPTKAGSSIVPINAVNSLFLPGNSYIAKP